LLPILDAVGDDGGKTAREPTGLAASAVVGLVLGALTAGAVLLLAEAASTADEVGALFVWVILAPLTTLVVMSAAGVALWRLRWPLQRWWWTIALAPVLAVLLAFGVFAGGPAGTMSERAMGWAAVSLAVAVGVAVVAGRRVSVWVRVLAAVVAIGAAPMVVAHDRASQDRWRHAAHARELAARVSTLAGVPEVLPVIPGYQPSATGGRGRSLQVDMTGPTTRLRLWIRHCPTCEAGMGSLRRTLVIDGYVLVVGQFDGRTEMLTTMTGVDVRPASRAELAALPAASYEDGD
jgi:hypothetical protein